MKFKKLQQKCTPGLLALLAWVCIFLSGYPVFSQNKVDSLRLLLDGTQSPQHKANILNELALELRSKDLQTAFVYIHSSIEISTQNNFQRELGVAQSVLGLLYSYTDLLDSAVYWNKSAIPLLLPSNDSLEISRAYARLGSDYLLQSKPDMAVEFLLSGIKWSNSPKVKAMAFNNLGMISKKNGDYANAVFYYQKALEQHEFISEPISKSKALNNLGALYVQKKDYVKAQNCYTEAYELIKDANDPESTGQCLSGLGYAAVHLGSKNDAIQYFSQAAQIFQNLGLQSDYSKQIVALADIYSELKNYKLAEYNYFLAEKILIEKKDKEVLSVIYNNLSECYLSQKRIKEAAKYLEKAYQMSQGYKDINFNRVIAKNLSTLYEDLGNAEKALKYRKIYESLNDEMVNVAENVKYAELNHAFETNKKEKKIEQQSQQITEMESNRNVYLAGLGGLMLLVLIITVLYRRRLKQQQLLEENITSISKQISSLKSENSDLKIKLVQTEKELESLVLKYSNAKEKLPENLVHLSKREYEVLLFIAEGLSDKEIAEKIFVSINTVRTHVRRIYDKLFVNSRVEAILHLNKYELLAEAF